MLLRAATKHGTLAVLQHCLGHPSSNARDAADAARVSAQRRALMRVVAGDEAEEEYGNWAQDALTLARLLREGHAPPTGLGELR